MRYSEAVRDPISKKKCPRDVWYTVCKYVICGTKAEAARKSGCSYYQVDRRLNLFKKLCPHQYSKFVSIFNVLKDETSWKHEKKEILLGKLNKLLEKDSQYLFQTRKSFDELTSELSGGREVFDD